MKHPELPLTAEGALAWARSESKDPEAVVPYPHPFDADTEHGGFAFVDGERLWFALHSGSFGFGFLHHGGTDEALDSAWAQAQHAARDLPWEDLGPWQRAAVTALALGTTVAELPPQHRAGIDTDLDRDHADWLWIRLRRGRHDPMRTLASDDHLLGPPVESTRFGRRTHACPLCGLPAPHLDRYPRAVCDDCKARTADREGRTVHGLNVSMSGGFRAYLRPEEGEGEGEVSEEVTRTGLVWVDGHPCTMGEARFGGIVVEALPDAG